MKRIIIYIRLGGVMKNHTFVNKASFVEHFLEGN
jgi:hypothetical protein